MRDLEKAKSQLFEGNLTLSIVKNGKLLFETNSHRITGFLDAIEKLGNKLEGASVADRVVGRAIALLCAYAKIKAVYAAVLSKNAETVLEENGIHHEWTDLVENILDSNKSGSCPFERLAAEISNPKDTYKMLKTLQDSLKQRKGKSFTTRLVPRR